MRNRRAALVTMRALLFGAGTAAPTAAIPRGSTPRMASLAFDNPVVLGAAIAVIGAVVAFLLPRRKSR